MSLLLALLPLALLSPARAEPVFDVPRGLYDAPFTLTVTPGTEGAVVWCGTGSARPTQACPAALELTTTTLVRAFERLPDGSDGPLVTHSYVFVDDVVQTPVMDTRITHDPDYAEVVPRSLRALPTISVVLTGAMSTSEQAVSVEWIDPDGEDSQVGAGAALVGGHSIGYPKNSIRLTFRSRYGAGRWDVALYPEDATGVPPVDEFDALTLRGGNHDSAFYLGAQGQYLRNLWMDETQLEMGHVAPHGRFAHLYLNGSYFGLYHVRERFNAAMMASYFGGEEEDWEAINGGSPFDGSGAAWSSLVSASTRYQEAKRWLDVPNFLDYMVLNYYAGNAWDWSYNHNWIAAGPVQPDQGGFRFHSSDSDICLYYDWDVNILSNPGPSYVFYYLQAEGDPDWRVALEDAIQRNLGPGGPLDAEVAGGRYARLAGLAEEAVVAESARWGLGWWDRDTYWVPERDRLLTDWFPKRSDEMWRQFKAAGWISMEAPLTTPAPGLVPEGTWVTLAMPDGAEGELWYTTDGSDPRLPGGAVSTVAQRAASEVDVELVHSRRLAARLRVGAAWGPLSDGYWEIDEAPPLLLNEWNTVGADELLRDDGTPGAGTDSAFGRVVGNGGDWIELLVLEDHLDLRGWTLSMADRGGARGTLVFTEDPLLADLRAGTILTVAEDLPEDPAYDPAAGDWRFHLRAGEGGSGTFVSAAAFDVTNAAWQLTVLDRDGAIRLGPVGEGVEPRTGLGGDEVGLFQGDPDETLRRADPRFGASRRSTYGSPNTWEDGVQDLSALRGERAGPIWEDTGEPDSGADSGADSGTETGETGDPGDTGGEAPPPGGCACGSGGVGAGLPALLLGLAALGGRGRGGKGQRGHRPDSGGDAPGGRGQRAGGAPDAGGRA